MVGLPYDEILPLMNAEELDAELSDGNLECGSYEYDSAYTDNIIGCRVTVTDSYAEIDDDILAEIIYFKKEFLAKFGVPGKVYLTMYIY